MHPPSRLRQQQLVMIGYMPRGPEVTISLRIVSSAKRDLSYFCMRACCPFLKRLACLSGQLANACMEHQGIALHCSNTKLGFEATFECMTENETAFHFTGVATCEWAKSALWCFTIWC